MLFLFSQLLKKNKQRTKQQMAWKGSRLQVSESPQHWGSQDKGGAAKLVRNQDQENLAQRLRVKKTLTVIIRHPSTLFHSLLKQNCDSSPGKPSLSMQKPRLLFQKKKICVRICGSRVTIQFMPFDLAILTFTINYKRLSN